MAPAREPFDATHPRLTKGVRVQPRAVASRGAKSLVGRVRAIRTFAGAGSVKVPGRGICSRGPAHGHPGVSPSPPRGIYCVRSSPRSRIAQAVSRIVRGGIPALCASSCGSYTAATSATFTGHGRSCRRAADLEARARAAGPRRRTRRGIQRGCTASRASILPAGRRASLRAPRVEDRVLWCGSEPVVRRSSSA